MKEIRDIKIDLVMGNQNLTSGQLFYMDFKYGGTESNIVICFFKKKETT
jgi:hypothetical protein